MAASPDRLVAGLVGNRYEVDGLIASGGMGSVYRARDTILDRIVALKVLRHDDPGFVGRFKTEATNAARLSHPNIVAIFDFGAPDGSPYMAMEYVDGQTLREVLHARGVLRPALASSIAAQVAAALEHARRAGLVHRDVKPENILVTTDGRVKVTDFGLSQALAASNATQSGTLMGTAHYLAPEQVRNGDSDHRTDVYALGVVLYEMLTGRPPFGGDSPLAIATRRVEHDVPRPGAVNPSVPEELDEIVARATARDPQDRYPTAGAMADALRAALPRADTDEVGALVHHTTAIPLDTEATVAIDGHGSRRRQRARAKRRRRVAIVATSLAALVAGSTIAAVQLRTHPVPDVVGDPRESATADLRAAGFEIAIREVETLSAPEGRILKQTPAAGARVAKGSKVTLLVAKSPPLQPVPDLRCMTQRQAADRLGADGFAASFSGSGRRVVDQSPGPGDRAPKGSTVTVYLGVGTYC